MKKLLFIVALLGSLGGNVLSEPLNTSDAYWQVKAYLELHGYTNTVPNLIRTEDTIKLIDLTVPLALPTDWPAYAVSKLPIKERKIVSGEWVALTDAEKLDIAVSTNSGVYAYQNAFLMICDTLSGTNTHEKLSFEAIPVYLKPLKASNREQFDALKDALSTINMALVEKAGTKWWTTCVWTEHPTVISNATVILNTLLTP